MTYIHVGGFGAAIRRAMAPRVMRTPTVDEFLATPPSEAEITSIRRDFNIYFDPPAPSWDEMLTIYNTFRGLKLIRFDVAVPLFASTNLYDWMRRNVTGGFYFSRTARNASCEAFPRGRQTIPFIVLSQGSRWSDPSSGGGGMGISALLLHEAWHCVMGRGHRASGGARDLTFTEGGAWAAQYYYYRWLAEHSGDYLSTTEREEAAYRAEAALGQIDRPDR